MTDEGQPAPFATTICLGRARRRFPVTEEPILLVDDNPVNLKLLRVTLSSRCRQLRTATSAEEVLALLESADYRPSLILLDIHLPAMNGLELTRRLKGDPGTRHIAIVAVTACASGVDEALALDAGCDGFIRKPIDTRLLPDEVVRFLTAARGARPGEPTAWPPPPPLSSTGQAS